MLILGLDPSFTGFGYCLTDTRKKGSQRVLKKGRMKTSSKEVMTKRLITQAERVRQLIKNFNPDKIGLEAPYHGDFRSSDLNSLYNFIQRVLLEEKKDVVVFAPVQVKAHAKGFANVPEGSKGLSKRDMINAVLNHTDDLFFAVKPMKWSNDEADAYWISYAAGRFWQFYCGAIEEKDLNKVERHQFALKKTYVRGKKAGTTEFKGLKYKEGERLFLWSREPDFIVEELF